MQICYEGKKCLKRIAVALVFLTLTAVVVIRLFSCGDDDKEVFNETAGDFAVTVDLDEKTEEADKAFLFDSLGGYGIKAAFFCTCDYIAIHKSEIDEIITSGHAVHMLISLPEKANKYELMLYIASENDRFFELMGKYPSYVRTMSKPNGDALEIFDKYGQIICNSTVKCTADGCADGDIIELADIDNRSVWALMSVITDRISKGGRPVTLSSRMLK